MIPREASESSGEDAWSSSRRLRERRREEGDAEIDSERDCLS